MTPTPEDCLIRIENSALLQEPTRNFIDIDIITMDLCEVDLTPVVLCAGAEDGFIEATVTSSGWLAATGVYMTLELPVGELDNALYSFKSTTGDPNYVSNLPSTCDFDDSLRKLDCTLATTDGELTTPDSWTVSAEIKIPYLEADEPSSQIYALLLTGSNEVPEAGDVTQNANCQASTHVQTPPDQTPPRPDTTRPDTTRPDTTRPDTTRPDTARPDSTRADSIHQSPYRRKHSVPGVDDYVRNRQHALATTGVRELEQRVQAVCSLVRRRCVGADV